MLSPFRFNRSSSASGTEKPRRESLRKRCTCTLGCAASAPNRAPDRTRKSLRQDPAGPVPLKGRELRSWSHRERENRLGNVQYEGANFSLSGTVLGNLNRRKAPAHRVTSRPTHVVNSSIHTSSTEAV